MSRLNVQQSLRSCLEMIVNYDISSLSQELHKFSRKKPDLCQFVQFVVKQ